jgi:hypothetical protein
MKPNLCPTCGYTLDAVSEMGNGARAPEPGDASLCIDCGEILEFAADMTLAKINEGTVAKLDPEDYDQLLMAQKFVRERPRKPLFDGVVFH